MARPQSITDEEVLAAARAVFLNKGITATVEEVAARCGVGQATVFRRFPTKQALFVAAMDSGTEPDWAEILGDLWPTSGRADAEDVRTALTALATEMLASGRRMFPLFLMKMSNPCLAGHHKPSNRLSRAVEMLTKFFAVQIRAGRVNASNPRVAARIWLGVLQHVIMFESFAKPVDDLCAEAVVEGLVELFCASAPNSTANTR